MKNTPFKEALQGLFSSVTQAEDKSSYNKADGSGQVEVGVVLVTRSPDGRGFEVKLRDERKNFRFVSVNHLFTNIRNELCKTGYAKILPIRNSSRLASQESSFKFPAIQHVEGKTVIFDPLLPFRNPSTELYNGNSILLLEFPSHEFFFAPLKKNRKVAEGEVAAPAQEAKVE